MSASRGSRSWAGAAPADRTTHRAGEAGRTGWPGAGAALVGAAVALGLLVAAGAVLGLAQRLGLVVTVPQALHVAGVYAAAVGGGFVAGRLAGRRGAVVGLVAGALLCAVAVWASSAGVVPPAGAQGPTGIDWTAAAWRLLLAMVAAALAGALGVVP